jgi:hypothetical protein
MSQDSARKSLEPTHDAPLPRGGRGWGRGQAFTTGGTFIFWGGGYRDVSWPDGRKMIDPSCPNR